jgi:hypothetical protein
MKINNIPTTAKEFAYDGCHKIYLLESEKDKQEALKCGFEIKPISELKDTYLNSCGLVFISSWDLHTQFVKQFEKARFTNN